MIRVHADLAAVQDLGRWFSLAMVQKYAHVSKTHRTRIIHLLDSKFTKAPKYDTNHKGPQTMEALSC